MCLRPDGKGIMKKPIYVLAVLLLLTGCNDREADKVSRSPQPVQTEGSTGQSTITRNDFDRQQAMEQARRDFSKSRFSKAVSLLRAALQSDPVDMQLWAQYDRALLARAGDDYLETVPKNRYRINMKSFLLAEPFWSTKYFLLDVREPEEFDRGHIKGSINVPFRNVLKNLSLLPRPEDAVTLLIICNTQHRANHVLVVLREIGYTNAYTLRGGYSNYIAWKKKLQGGDSGTRLEKKSGEGDGAGGKRREIQKKNTLEEQPEEDFSC